MRSSANYLLSSQPSDLEETPVFNVLIAYEDFEAGKNARRTYDFLAEQLGQDCEFATQMWKFDVLGIPKLRDMAAKDAMVADIIIVAYHGGKPLPEELKSWIDLWVNQDRHPLALVALYDNQSQDEALAASNREYLASVATQGGMEFFSQADSAPKPPAFGLSPSLPAGPRAVAPWMIAAQPESAIPRWGINE